MRVLHINCNYLTTALHQTMIEHLDETGVDSHIFAPIYDASLAIIKPNQNVTVSECFRKWDRIWFGYKQSKIIAAAEKAVDVASFDCIHAYTLFTDGNCAMKLSEKYGVPYVVAVRSTDLNDFLRLKPWLRGRAVEILEKASAVFFLSQKYLEDMIERHVPQNKKAAIRAKSQVVPNGIDDFWLRNEPRVKGTEELDRIRNKKVGLIVAGRVNKNKNQLTAMKAVEKLNQLGYDAHLTVVGPVEDEGIIRSLKNCGSVTCIGPQPKEKLIEHYWDNDIFVLPSYQETFGLVYAEAMSQGLPVLYTKGQGFDGHFPEGTVGYSIDPISPEDIADKVRTVCEEYHKISTNGPALAKRFEWKRIVIEYRKIYSQITKM